MNGSIVTLSPLLSVRNFKSDSTPFKIIEMFSSPPGESVIKKNDKETFHTRGFWIAKGSHGDSSFSYARKNSWETKEIQGFFFYVGALLQSLFFHETTIVHFTKIGRRHLPCIVGEKLVNTNLIMILSKFSDNM